MIWLLVVLLALASFMVIAFLFKAPRKGWEAVGAALLVGIAGYAIQANPAQPGAPKTAAQQVSSDGAALVKARQQLAQAGSSGANSWMVIGDALARNGQYADAASVLLGAVRHDPNNADGWLAVANSLVSHAEGTLSPAAIYAYRRAGSVNPDHPGPPFFLGLALAQNGRLEEARQIWADLLANSPKDAPWRTDLADRLTRLDAVVAAQGKATVAQ